MREYGVCSLRNCDLQVFDAGYLYLPEFYTLLALLFLQPILYLFERLLLIYDSKFLKNDANCINPPFRVQNIYHNLTLFLLLFFPWWFEHLFFEGSRLKGKHKALQLFLVDIDNIHTPIKGLFSLIMFDPSPRRKY